MNSIITYVFIATLMLITSCQDEDLPKGIPVTDDLLEGKWVLDSMSVEGFNTNEELFFVDGKMYRCSYWRNGYFIDSATYQNSKIDSYSDLVYTLVLTDSTHISLRNRIWYYFKKVRCDDLEKALNNYRIGDRERLKYVGFWKPINRPSYPIKLMNHSPDCDSVSFEIYQNGEANFHINQNKNVVVEHSFHVRGNAPQFGRGCIVGDYDLTWDGTETHIGLVFSKFYSDTIWFEKVRK